ncbi:MAG: DUF2460 domain-containing protein [Planctomycetes bacterium]|nr:DUF2460 domain-containing protein [Planctomycetota bacterium]
MGFHEVLFPTTLGRGSSGGPGWNTTFVENPSGVTDRIGGWANAKRRWNVAYGARNLDDIYDIEEFALCRDGALNSFRYRDLRDFSTGAKGRGAPAFGDVLIGIGDGATTQFQLIKRYSSGGTTKVRTILKPVSGTTVAGVNGVQKTAGTDFTVDTTTGMTTFTVAPPNGQNITAGCYFDCPVHFDSPSDEWLEAAIESVNTGKQPRVMLVEDLDPAICNEDIPSGGSQVVITGASVQIAPNAGKICAVNCTASGLTVWLPPPSKFPDGAEPLILHNNGANAFALKSGSTTIEASVAAGAKRWLVITAPSGIKSWLSLA